MSTQSTAARVHLPVFELRDVSGFPAYAVGSAGEVFSRWLRLPLGGGQKGFKVVLGNTWTRMRPSLAAGYRRVSLYRDGESSPHNVCVLVLTAFVGPCPTGQEARHGNGNRTDDRIDNLSWGTRKQNAEDRVLHGTQVRGEQHPGAKLTNDLARLTLELRDQGWRYREIAERLGVSITLIGNICRGQAWKHVTEGAA